MNSDWLLKYSNTYTDDVVTLLEAAWPWDAAHSLLVLGGGEGLYKVYEMIDRIKIAQVGKLVYLASMCMQVYCAFLCVHLHEEALQQGSAYNWQKN